MLCHVFFIRKTFHACHVSLLLQLYFNILMFSLSLFYFKILFKINLMNQLILSKKSLLTCQLSNTVKPFLILKNCFLLFTPGLKQLASFASFKTLYTMFLKYKIASCLLTYRLKLCCQLSNPIILF